MFSFHYSKIISAVMSAAVLVVLQSVMTAAPARAETTCQPGAQDEGGSRAASCAAHARNKAAFRRARAQVGGASEKQRPVATRCVAARGLPSHRGTWQLGIDRATGHRCWRLVAPIKPHARIVSAAKSSPGPNSSALSPSSAAANASVVTAPVALEAHRPSQPAEVLTSSIAKPSETPHVDVAQAPVPAEAGVIAKSNQVEGDELQPFDLRSVWITGQSLVETVTAMIVTGADHAKLSADNILQDAAAFMSVHGRPAIFLVVFLSVLTTVLALYALVAGSLKLMRPDSFREGASTIALEPPRYLENFTARPRQDLPTSTSRRESPAGLAAPRGHSKR